MSDVAEEVRFSLKLMINKEKTKVLFASVDSDFADILLSFLTVPLGGILRFLHNHYGGEKTPRIGCLNSLYNGLQNLDSMYFWTGSGKQMLLDPRSARQDEYHKLKLNVFDTRQTRYFTCGCRQFAIDYDSVICPSCEKPVNKEIEVRPGATENHGEAFTKKGVSFLIGDDLRMVPNVTGSMIQTLNNLGITDIEGAEFSTVSAGLNEIMELLKGSLFSRTPLTDLFLPERPASKKCKLEHSVLQLRREETSDSKNMKIKATIQKSKNEFLFAQAEETFIDFLFSLLTIPLGQVESLLTTRSSLACIDNLYQSVASSDLQKCLKDRKTNEVLLKPNLPPRFLSKHKVFSLEEEETTLYYHKNQEDNKEYLSKSRCESLIDIIYSFVDPKGKGAYVKGSTMFMVTDDLTVTPLCMLSSLSLIKKLEIPLSDIEEIEISIGREEALSILRASLTSTSALTNGLMLNQIKKIHVPRLGSSYCVSYE